MPTNTAILLLMGCSIFVLLLVLNKRIFKQGAMNEKFSVLLEDLSHIALGKHREKIEAIIADSKDLLAHGEEGVAFENLCENLHEWNFPLSQRDYDRLDELGRHYRFDSAKWDFLKKIVTSTPVSHE